MKFTIKNWAKFQHYKDRNPPWIKLATDTFQNYEFASLQDASKLLAICIWTLASRSDKGEIPADFDYIKRQCNLSNLVTPTHLKELVNHGFIVSDSVALAFCKQSAMPETEAYREEAEGETETETQRGVSAKAETDTEIKKGKSNGKIGRRIETELGDSPSCPDQWANYAANKWGWSQERIDGAFTEFFKYWKSLPGAKARKLDWGATFENRVDELQSRGAGNSRQAGGRGYDKTASAISAVVARRDGKAREVGGVGGGQSSGETSPDGRGTSEIEF